MNEPQTEWPVNFDQVKEAQLRDMLKANPAQRLAMAEELIQFVITAQKAKPIIK